MSIRQLHGDELVLSILEKELVTLTKKAAKAKADCEAAMNAGSEIIELRRKANQIISNTNTLGSFSNEKLAELKDLSAKEKKLLAISGNSLVKLMDSENHAEFTRDELTRIVHQMRFRLGQRGVGDHA